MLVLVRLTEPVFSNIQEIINNGDMNQPLSSQTQDNLVKDNNVGGDLVFAPVQIIETQIVQISVAEVTQQELILQSPYQGLRRFNRYDRERFFGRDKLIADLCKAVNQSSLTLILGASGSGKSSVVRAGLIPELRKSLESQAFYDFIFTPDQDPFESLSRCLLSEEKDYEFSKLEAEIALKSKPDTLTEVISTLRKDGGRWLIFIDQFEELFTICDDLDKRKSFISGLVRFVRSKNSFVKIILAMRSDFLEQLSFYPDFAAIAQNNIHLVSEMYPDELRQAIEQPAAKHGVVFEKGLVEQIIGEVEGQKGYLPLLQYTLNLLWESECQVRAAGGRLEIEDRTLNKRTYAALEGVRGALQGRVNKIYSLLNQDEQKTTKQIFLKLVNIVDTDSGSKAVSRRAYRYEFSSESVEKILNQFIEDNLLISSSEHPSSQKIKLDSKNYFRQTATVEIAHEILLSSWNELKQWLEQEKEAIVLKNWLAGEVRRWSKARAEGNELKARQELLRGSRLGQIVQFRDLNAFENVGGLGEIELEFIDASVEEAERLNDAQLIEEQLKRKRELDKANWLLIPSQVVEPISQSVESMSSGLHAVLTQNFEPQLNEFNKLYDSAISRIQALEKFPDEIVDGLFSGGISKLAKSHVDMFYSYQDLSNRGISRATSIEIVKYFSTIDGALGALTGLFSLESALITAPIDIFKSWAIQVYVVCLVAHFYSIEPSKDDALTVLFSSDEEVLKLFRENAVGKRLRVRAGGGAINVAAQRLFKDAAEEILKKLIGKVVDKSVRKFFEKVIPFVFGATLSASTCWWDTVQTGKRAILYYEYRKDLDPS